MNTPPCMRDGRKNAWLAILLIAVFLNGLLWSVIIPFDGAPDEVHKYEVVYFIWKNHRIPTFGSSADLYIRDAPNTRDGHVYGVSATYPPGAYLVASLFMHLSPSDASPSILMHAARLASVVCTVATTYFLWKISYRLFGSITYALGVASFTAFIPQFTYTGAYVGDDAYQILAVTATLWATLRGLQEGWTLRNSLLAGLALVLVSMGKQNGWVAVSPFVLLGFSSTWQMNWRQKIRTWATVFLPPLVTLVSWLTRNWLLYGDLLALRIGRLAWADYINRIGLEWVPLAQRGYGFLHLLLGTEWLAMVFKSFWGYFFYMSVPMNPHIYRALLGVSLAGIACTAWALWKKRDELSVTGATVPFLTCSAVAVGLLFVTTATSSLYNDFQPQGRYLFPLITPISIFLSLGFYTLSRLHRDWLPILLSIIGILLFVLNVFSLTHYVSGHPYPEIPLPRF